MHVIIQFQQWLFRLLNITFTTVNIEVPSLLALVSIEINQRPKTPLKLMVLQFYRWSLVTAICDY